MLNVEILLLVSVALQALILSRLESNAKAARMELDKAADNR